MEKDTYDRKAAGIRIREKRRQLGITMKEAAEKLGRVPTYYADIERGNCGMSVETMIAISRLYHMSLDYLILGKEDDDRAVKDREINRTEGGISTAEQRVKAGADVCGEGAADFFDCLQ